MIGCELPTRSNDISWRTRKQLGLDLEVDVADLVEEERAAVGLLEPPDAVAVGPGERTLDVAEQLAFEQALRQGGAVELDERPARAGARLMDRRGQKLLAGAALAPDQHGRVSDRDLAGHADHLPDGRARALDRLEGPEVAVARRLASASSLGCRPATGPELSRSRSARSLS